MADDGLKKYNTGAYVPEGTSNDGVVVGGGSRAVNDAGVWNENTSESRGGAQEEASGVRDVSMSGLSGKSQEETGNGPRMQNGSEAEKMGSRGDSPVKKSSKKKWGWVVVAILVVLTAAGVGVWWALNSSSDDEDSVSDTGAALAELPDGEIDLENTALRELYGWFVPGGLQDFYRGELLDDDREKGQLEIALNTSEQTGCKGERGADAKCYDGGEVRKHYEELFGEEIILTDEKYGKAVSARGEGLFVYENSNTGDINGIIAKRNAPVLVSYAASEDEFYEAEGGFDGGGAFVNRLERAEKEGDYLYLFERAILLSCRPDPFFNDDGEQTGNGSACSVTEAAAIHEVSEFGWTGKDEEMTDDEVMQIAQKKGLGGLKLTFRKNEGWYVFEKMERENGGVEQLSLDNELVQRLYGKFERVGLWMSGTENFYVDEEVRNGDLSKALMIAVAMPSVAGTGDIPCTGEYDGVIGDSCYSGDTIRARIKEIFGEDVSFEDGDRNDDVTCRWEYSAKNDEFYGFVGCGGSCQYRVHRDLDRAEQQGDNIYLYETAYGETCQALYHVNGDLIAEMKFDENGNVVKGFEADDYRDQMDQFKWTFTKNNEENYVFAGLEQVK